jgi:Fuc2NAc and GlcNAc transferase
MTVLALALAVFGSALGCWAYLALARRWQILDRPNERSSHTAPTPHGGGAPLLLAFALAVFVATPEGASWQPGFMVLLTLSVFLMMLGVLDDLRGLSVFLRFACYGGCCLLAAWLILPGQDNANGLALLVLCAFCLLWSLNLYNFMDGIDGIAAIQCFLACASGGLLAFVGGGDPQYALFCVLLALAHLGFLAWNWPPARLFMGDAGSVPTGFLLAGLALLGEVSGVLPAACWLILLAVFITDASWTLCWRLWDGQRIFDAHRLHAYQRLSRHWQSHLAVDFGLVAINACWLFPLAWAAQANPQWQLFLVILAYLPLVLAMAKLRRLT